MDVEGKTVESRQEASGKEMGCGFGEMHGVRFDLLNLPPCQLEMAAHGCIHENVTVISPFEPNHIMHRGMAGWVLAV